MNNTVLAIQLNLGLKSSRNCFYLHQPVATCFYTLVLTCLLHDYIAPRYNICLYSSALVYGIEIFVVFFVKV